MTVATALDAYPAPPCAKLLGWRLIDARPDEGWVRVGFLAKRDFLNPAGFVQGGFLAAMLDDTMGPAMFVKSQGRLFTPTIDMHVSFIAPAEPGPLFGEGRVVQANRTVAFLEGQLTDELGTLLARATATARLVPVERALG